LFSAIILKIEKEKMNKDINIRKNYPQYFFTADTHFGHYNIIKHCNRPWNAEEHDEALIERWNSVINVKDIVYHLGDFAMFRTIKGGSNRMKAYRQLRARLKGKIHLVKGNHDSMSQELYSSFTEVYGFGKDIKINKEKITICHYPMRSWNSSFHASFHAFGHVHSRLENANTGVSCDVGVDVPEWNYTPVHWEAQLRPKLLKKQEIWNNKYKI